MMCDVNWCWDIKLNQPCIPGLNSTGVWYIILLIQCWIRFASVLLRIESIISKHRLSRYAPKDSVLWYPLVSCPSPNTGHARMNTGSACWIYEWINKYSQWPVSLL
jgi:hypothetical protein